MDLHKLSMEKVLKAYDAILTPAIGTDQYYPLVAELAKADRFFLLTHLLHRVDVIHPWLYDRCRELEADPDDRLDLWSRYHYKSTLGTFAGAIQEIARDPEITICILSFNNSTASTFLLQIKNELEKNDDLKLAFPNIFYEHPKRDSPTWSLDKGIVVKRRTNPKEATVEAYGLVDNQPVGRHYQLRIYDDVVTMASVTTPDMIEKTTEAWELSQSLGAGRHGRRKWHFGTRYNAADSYQHLLDKQVLIPRIHPATDDGTPTGKLVFMDQDEWDELVNNTSDYVLACQQLLNPLAGKQREFSSDWVRRWEVRPRNLNVYILCDPAGGRKAAHCNTAMPVIGLDVLGNKYLLDGACHKMDLTQRWEMLKHLFFKWKAMPGIQTVIVGYEMYSMQADIAHFKVMMQHEKKYFPIQEVGGSIKKEDRIRRLIPDFKNWAFFLPEVDKFTRDMKEALDRGHGELVARPIKRKDPDNNVYELTEWVLKHEYNLFPHNKHKDFLDAMSRLYDMELLPPIKMDNVQLSQETEFDNFGGPCYYEGICLEPESFELH